MRRRSALFALTASSLLFAQNSPISRNWAKHPAIVQIDTEHRIFAIGDPHADPSRLSRLLVGAKIIAAIPKQPADLRWTAGKATVVFTGDFTGKGPDSLAVIAVIRALEAAAAKDGGLVIVTMGNHEAEFLADPSGHKTKDFQAELLRAHLNPADVAACKGDLGKFLCDLPFAARVDDWFFSHGGNTNGRTLSQLASDLQSGVDKDGFQTSQLVGADSLLEARLGESPWFEPNGAQAQATLQAYCKALGVKHIVQGHQPGKVVFSDGGKRNVGEIFQRYGLIFLEDTGMSEGVNDSEGALLLISPKQETATAICFDGTATVIWDKQAHKNQGSIAPCVSR